MNSTNEEDEDGGDLPPEINKIKEQIEKERLRHIYETFELKCKPSMDTGSSHHQTLALIRSSAEDDNENERDNNTLLSRMQTPLRSFSSGFIYYSESEDESDLLDDDDDDDDDDVEYNAPIVKLPFVEQLPRFITWVFADSNQLMVEGDSVMNTIQYYRELEDSEVTELSSQDDEEEETVRYKYEFSEGEDLFIWKIGQEYGFDDVVVQSALTRYLEVDFSDILERFSELKLKNEETVGEASNSRSTNSIIPTFQAALNLSYCRRCLVFDCNTHEKSQPEMKPRDDELYESDNEDERIQCSEHCYLKARSVREADNDNSISKNKGKNVVSDTITANDANADMKTIWTPEEKDLYLKGLEIYERNSCLIAKNALPELKTCLEVYNYMREQDQRTMLFGINIATKPKIQVIKRKTVIRKKLQHHKNMRFRKHSHHRPRALRKTANAQEKLCKHYAPCTCDSICADQCHCFTNDNCCEKYCGCLKECKNRYGGCNCVMGQCIKRHCPCFAASRECDPDICRNCCLTCGDETSDRSQCKNMRVLLKKHKKILIAKSDIHGWGAFTRYSLKKNDYLGEYTGELISHSEADERGIIEQHFGTSYLFNLNDQLEIDARRKGNKLKYLNHSAKPNCFARLMIVRGDHRIGLFAKKEIEEGEELLFDYGYGAEQAEWSRGRKFRKTRRRSKNPT